MPLNVSSLPPSDKLCHVLLSAFISNTNKITNQPTSQPDKLLNCQHSLLFKKSLEENQTLTKHQFHPATISVYFTTHNLLLRPLILKYMLHFLQMSRSGRK